MSSPSLPPHGAPLDKSFQGVLLYLDSDRDGKVDATPANNSAWVPGKSGPGAILAVKTRAYSAGETVAERLELEFRWTGPEYAEGWLADFAVDHPDRVRVYDAEGPLAARQEGARQVLGVVAKTVFQLDAVALGELVRSFSHSQYGLDTLQDRAFDGEDAFLGAVNTAILSKVADDDVRDKAAKRRALKSKVVGALGNGEVKLDKATLAGLQDNLSGADSAVLAPLEDRDFRSVDALLEVAFPALAPEQLQAKVRQRLDLCRGAAVGKARRDIGGPVARYEFAPGTPIRDRIASERKGSLWIEATDFPAAEDESAWLVTLTFRFRPNAVDPGRTQTAVLRIAPWMMAGDLEKNAAVFAKDVRPPNSLAVAAKIREYAGPTPTLTVLATKPEAKAFMRDVVKSGHSVAPHYRGRAVITDLDAISELDIKAKMPEAGADVGLFKKPRPGEATSQDNGGNYMVTPPLAGYPWGRIIFGQDREGKYTCNFGRFFMAQRVQKPIVIDPTWLSVGHADELVCFLPDRGPRARAAFPYKVLIASPLMGYYLCHLTAYWAPFCGSRWPDYMMQLIQDAGRWPPTLRGNFDVGFELPRERAKPAPFPGPPLTGALPYNEALAPEGLSSRFVLPSDRGHYQAEDIVSAYLTRERLNEVLQIQKLIEDGTRRILQTELSLEPSDFIEVPVWFQGGIPLTADSVNMLVINDPAGKCRCLLPKPFGPVLGRGYVFESYIKDKLRPLDLESEFLEDWHDLHVHEGEIHCGTNQLPVPLPVGAQGEWWAHLK